MKILEVKDIVRVPTYASCHESTWESGGLTPYILEFSIKCGWSASCLSHTLNRRLGGPLIRSISFGKDKN